MPETYPLSTVPHLAPSGLANGNHRRGMGTIQETVGPLGPSQLTPNTRCGWCGGAVPSVPNAFPSAAATDAAKFHRALGAHVVV
jgi:hypothetical protein